MSDVGVRERVATYLVDVVLSDVGVGVSVVWSDRSCCVV